MIASVVRIGKDEQPGDLAALHFRAIAPTASPPFRLIGHARPVAVVSPGDGPGEALVVVLDGLRRATNVGEDPGDFRLNLRHTPFDKAYLDVSKEMVKYARPGDE